MGLTCGVEVAGGSPGVGGRVEEFRARENAEVIAASDQHLAVGQQGRGVESRAVLRLPVVSNANEVLAGATATGAWENPSRLAASGALALPCARTKTLSVFVRSSVADPNGNPSCFASAKVLSGRFQMEGAALAWGAARNKDHRQSVKPAAEESLDLHQQVSANSPCGVLQAVTERFQRLFFAKMSSNFEPRLTTPSAGLRLHQPDAGRVDEAIGTHIDPEVPRTDRIFPDCVLVREMSLEKRSLNAPLARTEKV